MTRLVVEAGFGHTITDEAIEWTDLTSRVDISQGVHINRGASDELSQTQAGTCTLVLDNSDGALTAGLATSPYYPNVKKNVPLRVAVVTAGKNLIREGSFELDPATGFSPRTGWDDNPDDPTFSNFADATRAHVGTQAMLINWANSGTGGILQATVYGLEIGQTYTASAYVYVELGDPAVRLNIDGGPVGNPSTVNDAFERISVTWTATGAVHVLQITSTVTSPTSGDRVWMDAVQVEEGEVPTAFDGDFAQLHRRFIGLVNQWPTKWKGLYASAIVTCTDGFKILALEDELQPMLVQETLDEGPLAYYPLSEPEDSTSAGDISGTSAGPLTIQQAGTGGLLTFGQDDATGPPTDGLPVPVFDPAGASDGKYLTADLGQDYADRSSQNWLFFECWFSTTVKNRVLFALKSLDDRYQIVFLLDINGQLTIEWTSTGSGAGFAVTTAATGDLADGAVHHLVYDEERLDVIIDDGTPQTISVDGMFRLQDLTVGAFNGARLWDGTISHLALHAPDSAAPGWYTDHYQAGATAYVGEAADVRMARIAGYVGLTVDPVGSTFDGMASQGELGSTPKTHLRDIETTEAGRLFADRAAAQLVFQSRDVRFNPDPAVTLEYADLETDDFVQADDDQKLTNIVLASRRGGATVRILDRTSVDTHGPYRQPLTLLKDTDAAVVDRANWIVQRYADPPPELRQVPVNAATLPLAIYRGLLDADISTSLALTGLPAEAPAGAATVTVEGYSETIHHGQHLLDFHTSRTDTDSVWVLDDPTYSVLGTTTRLAY